MKAALVRQTEAEFTRAVLALAKLLGWSTFHVRPARTLRGWRTAVQGDGCGFPDVLMIHHACHRIVVAELKADGGRLTREQARWLELFRSCGVPAFVWRPSSSWPEIERVLRNEEAPSAARTQLAPLVLQLERLDRLRAALRPADVMRHCGPAVTELLG